MNAHFGDGRIDQEQASQRQQDDSASGKHAVAGELGFGGEKQKGADDHGNRREAHRQQVQGERRQQDEDHAHGSGNDRAGMVEFGVEGKGSDGEQDEGDVRVHEVGELSLIHI